MMAATFGYRYITLEEKGDPACSHSYSMFVNAVRSGICSHISRFGPILSSALTIKCQ